MAGGIGTLLVVIVVVVAGVVIAELMSASAESMENPKCCSVTNFVGEANRLSGRMCSKLFQ